MAGLRWWNYINDEGQSVWNFESSSVEDQIKFSKAEIQIFWFGLIIFPVIWVRWVFCFLTSTNSDDHKIMSDLPAAHSFLHIQDKVGGAGDHEPRPLRIKPLRISEVIGTFLIFMNSE